MNYDDWKTDMPERECDCPTQDDVKEAREEGHANGLHDGRVALAAELEMVLNSADDGADGTVARIRGFLDGVL